MVIDLAGLRRVEIDPEARTALAGGGVLWGDFDAATLAHGLHTPGGRITTTGVGGFTTGGGYGWTSSKYGLTCDNLISAEVVLADGSVVRASATENTDLFWAIRGGGGNFGIVTEFEFRLHALVPIVLAGLALWPLDRAREVMSAWRDIVDEAPEELSSACVILTAPPEEFVPDHLKGQAAMGMAVMYVGDPEAGVEVVQPLKDLAPEVDLIQPMPYTAFQAMLDPSFPRGLRSYWRGEYMNSLGDDAIRAFTGNAPDVQAAGIPFSQMILFRVGQAIQAGGEVQVRRAGRERAHRFAEGAIHRDHVVVVSRVGPDPDRMEHVPGVAVRERGSVVGHSVRTACVRRSAMQNTPAW